MMSQRPRLVRGRSANPTNAGGDRAALLWYSNNKQSAFEKNYCSDSGTATTCGEKRDDQTQGGTPLQGNTRVTLQENLLPTPEGGF